jgi:hypothetical protein
MRRSIWFAAIMFVIALVNSGAFADTTTTFTGRVVDPHGNAVPDYLVWAKLGQTYQVTSRSDSQGRFTLNVPTQPSNNCWIVGGSPDEFYTGSGVPGTVCGSSTVQLNPLYRVRSQLTPKETYVSNLGSIPYHLELYANSRSNPAPFASDPLTYTLTYHTISPTQKIIYAQGVMPAPTATAAAGGITRYEWKIDLTPVVTKPTMIHVDWGNKTNFGQMMDCRMIFAGITLLPRTGQTYMPASVVTLDGAGFGALLGKLVLETNTSVTWVDPKLILSWTDTRIQFVIPPNVNSDAYVRAWRADGLAPWCMAGGPGLPTNKIPLKIKVI